MRVCVLRLLWRYLGRANTLARGVLHIEIKPKKVGVRSSQKENIHCEAAAKTAVLPSELI